jgi:hypothetical protein
MQKIIFFLLTASIFVSNGFAQVVGENLAYLPEYQKQLPYFQELITGGQYAEASRLIQGNPYFASRQFENGTLSINGIVYPEVPLLYDSYLDQVVTFHPIFSQKILIKPDKIDGFVLSNGSSFRFISGNSDYQHHGNGIYEVLGQGDFTALAKRFKATKELRELSQYDAVFVEKSDFFLWQSGEFFQIGKANQAIEILGLNRKVTKKQLRATGMNFKQNPERFLQYLVSNFPQN